MKSDNIFNTGKVSTEFNYIKYLTFTYGPSKEYISLPESLHFLSTPVFGSTD